MNEFIEMLKQDLETLSPNYLLHVAREEFGIENTEDYTISELIEQCVRVEVDNALQ